MTVIERQAADRSDALVERLFNATIGALELYSVYLGAELGLYGSPEEAVGAVIELTPSGRLGEVEDMADAVVFLASDASRFINGAGVPVDGGMGM